jgi:hypothetical protein
VATAKAPTQKTAATEAGNRRAEAAGQRCPRPQPHRHPRDLRHHAGKAQVGADVPVVGDQPERPVGQRGADHGEDRPEDAGALTWGGSAREVAGVPAEQPGQERLGQGLLQVQALDHMQDGAASQQADRRQPGGPVPTPKPIGQQQ